MQFLVIPNQVAAQVKALRQAQQVSVAEVAGYMQVSQSRYSRIENRPLAIKLHQFYLLMEALGADVLPFPDLAALRDQLVQARRATGLTQARFGPLVGVTQSRIAHIEADPAHISVELFLKLLATLQIPLYIGQHVYRPSPAAQARLAPQALPEPQARAGIA